MMMKGVCPENFQHGSSHQKEFKFRCQIMTVHDDKGLETLQQHLPFQESMMTLRKQVDIDLPSFTVAQCNQYARSIDDGNCEFNVMEVLMRIVY